MRRSVIALVAVMSAVTVGCSSGSNGSSTSTTRRATTTSTNPRVPTTDPAAPGVVHVDLTAAAATDTAPDAVVASFTFGNGPGQLGFVPGNQAENIAPSGFVLTRDGTAVIDDVVNHRLVRVAVPTGTRRPNVAAPDICDGNMRLGPQEVLYISCQEEAAFGLNAFATAGPTAGHRLAGPSGRASSQGVQGGPLVFTPTQVVDPGSANPLPYVTTTGQPLPNPNLPTEPVATASGGITHITYRTGADAALRSWDVVTPNPGGVLPILLTALPDATVVAGFLYDSTQRLVVVRLTSHGAARAFSFPLDALSQHAFVQADSSGAYVLESQGSAGGRLVRYRLGS
ncbi:MAG: hypothetical protein ACXV9P_02140 [Acidimicrobiia bacterium]